MKGSLNPGLVVQTGSVPYLSAGKTGPEIFDYIIINDEPNLIIAHCERK